MRLKYFLSILIFAAIGTPLFSQIFQATPDNAFIKPATTGLTAIDVLANDIFDNHCVKEDLKLTIVSGPTMAADGAQALISSNRIMFTAQATTHGTFKIVYKIECPDTGASDTAELLVYVNDQPEFVNDAQCYIDPVGINFEMEEVARTNEVSGLSFGGKSYWIDPTSYLTAGDIDGDGNIEILAALRQDGEKSIAKPIIAGVLRMNTTTNTVQIVNVLTNTTNGETGGLFLPSFAIAKITGNNLTNSSNLPSIFVSSTTNSSLYRYDYNKVTNTYKLTWSYSYAGNTLYPKFSPLVVDFMGDGHQQVLIGDRIICADKGILLARCVATDGSLCIPNNNTLNGYGFGRYGCRLTSVTIGTTAHNGYSAAPLAIDIDGDGILEVIGGHCVYQVNLVNYTGSVGNSYKYLRRAIHEGTALDEKTFDGATSPIDIDGDGLPEIVVAGFGNIQLTSTIGYLYIYNPRTGALLHSNQVTFPRSIDGYYGPSRIFVGDIDADGVPEICFNAYLVLYAYELDGNTLKKRWELTTTDSSASTTLSMFDFTQSGKARLIYRDESDLRIISDTIIGGVAQAFVEETIPNVGSGTVNEAPIILDVDGDGHAEILACGATPAKLPNLSWNWKGSLRIYAAKNRNWAPARKLWNQEGYNPIFVNDDLTIPQNPVGIGAKFNRTDGGINQPFNNFLQQSTELNREGSMILLGPDLAADPAVPKRLNINQATDVMTVSIGIINQGDAVFQGPISLQLYAEMPGSPNTFVAVGDPYSHPNTGGLNYETGDNKLLITDYAIPNISSVLPSGYVNLHVAINLSSAPDISPRDFSGSTECLGGLNNIVSGFAFVAGSRVMCENETESLTVSPSGIYHIKWYEQAIGGTSVQSGDTYTLTKDNTPVTHMFVEVYTDALASNPLTSKRDTIFFYKTPDSLIWNGRVSADWHNPENWRNPNSNDYPFANIPRACTNVLIPDNLLTYPDLSGVSTAYTEYTSAACNGISFQHGGEVVRPDMLTYTKAYVDVTLNSHRWYLFAPPLKDFYTGDIYRLDPIPANDDVKAYTRYWARRNPLTTYYGTGWTGAFNTPDQSFLAGQGVNVWISDKAISGQTNPPQDPFEFSYPKGETKQYIYQEDTTTPIQGPFNTTRTNSHRFIFDGVSAGTNFSLKLDGDLNAGDKILIGNPFMSNLNFDLFYAANSANIESNYTIFDANGAEQVYDVLGVTTTSLDEFIAPMQGVFITLKTSNPTINANGNMTASSVGNKLKTGINETQKSTENHFGLSISALSATTGLSHKAHIEFKNSFANNYKQSEDIASTILDNDPENKSLNIYTTSLDGQFLLINKLNSSILQEEIEIPFGFKQPFFVISDDITINISGLNFVPNSCDVFIYDKLKNRYYDLTQNTMITIEDVRSDNDFFVRDRFYLKFAKTGSSLEETPNKDANINLWTANSILHFESSEPIETLDIFNAEGRLIASKKINASNGSHALPLNTGIFIVKLSLSDKIVTKKIIK